MNSRDQFFLALVSRDLLLVDLQLAHLVTVSTGAEDEVEVESLIRDMCCNTIDIKCQQRLVRMSMVAHK